MYILMFPEKQKKTHSRGTGLRTVTLYSMVIDLEQQEGLNIKKSSNFIFQSGLT